MFRSLRLYFGIGVVTIITLGYWHYQSLIDDIANKEAAISVMGAYSNQLIDENQYLIEGNLILGELTADLATKKGTAFDLALKMEHDLDELDIKNNFTEWAQTDRTGLNARIDRAADKRMRRIECASRGRNETDDCQLPGAGQATGDRMEEP